MGQTLQVQASIQLDNLSVFPGQTLSGLITANVPNEISTPQFLTLKVSGKIKTQIAEYTLDEEQEQTEKLKHKQKDKVLELTVPIVIEQFEVGVVQKRFEVSLPTDLPPSIKFRNSGTKAKIKYKVALKAGENKIAKSKFKVLTPLAVDPQPLQIVEDEIQVGACCCFTPAFVEINANLDKRIANIGDDLIVDFEAFNRSDMKFEKLEFYLKQTIIVKALSQTWKHKEKFSHGTIHPQFIDGCIKLPLKLEIPHTVRVPTLRTSTFWCEYQIIIGLGTGCGQGRITIPLDVNLSPSICMQDAQDTLKVASGVPVF